MCYAAFSPINCSVWRVLRDVINQLHYFILIFYTLLSSLVLNLIRPMIVFRKVFIAFFININIFF